MIVEFKKMKALLYGFFTVPLICFILFILGVIIPLFLYLIPLAIFIWPLMYYFRVSRQYCYVGKKSLDIKVDGNIQTIRYNRIDSVILKRDIITIRYNGKNIKLLHVKQASLIVKEINEEICND